MKYNSYIDPIKRIFIPRPTREVNKRFDMSERTINFSDKFFGRFIDTIKQEDIITYPSYADYDDFKKEIAVYNGVEADNVYLSTGSDVCIKSLCEITMQPGFNIVSNVPCFPMYGIYASFYGGEHIGVEYQNTTNFSLKYLMESVNDKTRLVVVANPNSPIGDYKTIDELREVCKFLNDRNIIFLIDEAYVDFSPDTVLPLIHEYDNVAISRTFSKALGAAGIRVGYLLASKKLTEVVTKVQLTYPISGVSLKFASFLLNNFGEVDEYINQSILGRERLCNLLEASDYDVVWSHTNSIHFHESFNDNSKTISKLRKEGLSFKSGDKKTGTPVRIPGDDRETWIRLSVGPDIDKIIGDII